VVRCSINLQAQRWDHRRAERIGYIDPGPAMKPRHAIPDNIARRMRPEDRAELGIETAAEAVERGEARLEADVQRACESWLLRHGVPYLHLSFRAREKKGWPDLAFPWRGRFVAVELKTATGKATSEQLECLAAMARHGAVTAILRGYEAFVEFVEAIGSVERADT
jgi:delta-aminolevulinic acid dehydratase/porphobilinogen synthase